MQSDLDMVSGLLSKQLQDIDLLLRSGVLRQSSAIVLSQPGPGSDKEDLGFFIRDLFTRLQIGGIEFKRKALESLIQLLTGDYKAAILVAKEGTISYLIQMLDMNNDSCIREQVVTAISILSSASDPSRQAVFEDGGLGPLLRILETGSSVLKEKAAIGIEAITSDPENAWGVLAYSGVSVLIEACRSGSPLTQTHAAGAIKNISFVEDIRTALAEEGAVNVLIELLVSGTVAAQNKAANFIEILGSFGEYFRSLIFQEGGLHTLLQLLHETSSSETVEHVLRAITSLSCSDFAIRTLSSSSTFILQLAELIKQGNIAMQQISASLLAKLSITDADKRACAGCMGSLVKLMESAKPVGLQEVAVEVLGSLLTVRSNRKDLVRDEKSLSRLVQMLDPKNETVSKEFPVMVIAAIVAGGSNSSRKRLLAAGVHPFLQKLTEMEVAGAKKAAQRLAGNRLKSIYSRAWRE